MPTDPMEPVSTSRLILSPVSGSDVGELWELYQDPLVAHWTGPWTLDDVEIWARGMADRWTHDGVGKWMAHERSDGTLVGRGGLSRTELGGETVLEVGWAIRDALRGRGYASEICRAALDRAATAFPDLPVISFTEVHNHASRAVMRRVGLRDVGVIRREGLIAGRDGLHADAPFALSRRDPMRAGPPA